jgi:hypothetical protein
MASKSKKLKKGRREFLGYQIISKDGNIDIPEEFYSFEIIRTKRVLDDFFRKDKSGRWMVVPVYSGEIEEPTFV